MVKLTEMVLDDLVAGELSGDQYRAVLRQLDATPDGWKRCALAFLEDQAFREDLGQLLGEQPAADVGIWSEHDESHRSKDMRSCGLVPESNFGGKPRSRNQMPGQWGRRLTAINARATVQPAVRVWGGSGGHGRLEWLTRFTSLAALLLVSFTIGWFGSDVQGWRPASSRSQGGSVPSQSSANNSRSDVAAADVSDGTAGNSIATASICG